jgi:hypothetical protein
MATGRRQGDGAEVGDAGFHAARPLPAYAPGAHLVSQRRGYVHHGIYVGDGRVVHYGGLSRSWRRGPVEEVTLERFAAGRPVMARPPAASRFGSDEIVARARSRIGEDRYRIASNNCEHFCAWCIHGEPRSEQIEQLLRLPRRLLQRFRPVARRLAAATPSTRSLPV